MSTQSPDNLEFLGRLPEEELARLYARASVLLAPYEKEGFGMAVLESMASGTPVLALNDGNLPHLLREKGGVLCESLNSEEWTTKFDRIQSDKVDLHPQQVAKVYSWEKVAIQYERVYNQVI